MDDDWHERLSAAIEDTGRTYKDISQCAGLGPNFVSQMLRERKTPSVANLDALCREINVSVIWILTGADMSKDVENLIKIFTSLSSHNKNIIISLVEQLQSDG